MFLCKSYIVGGEIVEQMILFETLDEAMKWATRNARDVPCVGCGWDSVYHVAIYELQFGIPFVDAYSPGKPIKTVKP